MVRFKVSHEDDIRSITHWLTRSQNRWLLVDVTFQPDVEGKLPSSTLTLLRTVRASLQDNFGDIASGALGGSIAIKYYSASTHTAIIRCSRVGVKEVWGALTLCNEWEGKSVRLVTLHCGGKFCFRSSHTSRSNLMHPNDIRNDS
jgi:RNase P/RNase MRP subunit POP5